MFALFGAAKMRNREQQIPFITEVTGVTVQSRRDLSYTDAGKVIGALQGRLDEASREGG